jgi:hypothetical protein
VGGGRLRFVDGDLEHAVRAGHGRRRVHAGRVRCRYGVRVRAGGLRGTARLASPR